MNKLELLWKLQEHDRHLRAIRTKLEEIGKKEKIEELRVLLKQKEYDLSNKTTLLELDNMKIKRCEQKLKQLSFDIKEIDEKLYSGEVTNFKQLEQMGKDSEEHKKEKEKVEYDVILLMEEVESLQSQLKDVEESFNKLKRKLYNMEIKHRDAYNKLKAEMGKEKALVDDILEHLDEKTRDNYNALKSKKGSAIATVVNDMCTGCHMGIPLSILSKIKTNNAIVCCDNCGRILYYTSQEETNE